MTQFDANWLDQLDGFMSLFGDSFRRRDQARWASVYLRALLTVEGRKTINRLAHGAALSPELTAEDAAQALQNFVNQSPWDEQAIWRRCRSLLAERLAGPEGVFVADDLTFVKQGRHSVGVQRQYSNSLGRKANCQIAVALYYVSATGAAPLGLRLYLPRAWLQQPERLDAAGVPHESRRAVGKAAVALELLDEVRKEGWPALPVLGGAGHAASADFLDGLHPRGLSYLPEAAAEAASVRRATAEVEASLTEGLGLHHFEGRSWRGFHHHACLVALAYVFRQLHGCRGGCLPAAAVGA